MEMHARLRASELRSTDWFPLCQCAGGVQGHAGLDTLFFVNAERKSIFDGVD